MFIFKLLEELHTRTLHAPDEGGAGAGTATDAGKADGDKGGDTKQKDPDGDGKAAERKHAEAVPYERFQAVNEAKKAAEDAAAAAKAELTRLQRSGLPELDQIKAERDDLKRQLDEANGKATAAEERATNLEKSGWVRTAAQAAGFIDAEDALARIKLDSVKTEAGAQRAVGDLAESAKHLVKAKTDESQAGVLREILAGGKAKDGAGDGDRKLIPTSQLEGMTQEQHIALMERDPELYHRSLAAAEAA